MQTRPSIRSMKLSVVNPATVYEAQADMPPGNVAVVAGPVPALTVYVRRVEALSMDPDQTAPAGTLHTLYGTSLWLGREAQCSLRLDDDTLSRFHLALRWNGRSYEASDRSRNGNSHCNGRKFSTTLLAEGDELSLGMYSVQVMGISDACGSSHTTHVSTSGCLDCSVPMVAAPANNMPKRVGECLHTLESPSRESRPADASNAISIVSRQEGATMSFELELDPEPEADLNCPDQFPVTPRRVMLETGAVAASKQPTGPTIGSDLDFQNEHTINVAVIPRGARAGSPASSVMATSGPSAEQPGIPPGGVNIPLASVGVIVPCARVEVLEQNQDGVTAAMSSRGAAPAEGWAESAPFKRSKEHFLGMAVMGLLTIVGLMLFETHQDGLKADAVDPEPEARSFERSLMPRAGDEDKLLQEGRLEAQKARDLLMDGSPSNPNLTGAIRSLILAHVCLDGVRTPEPLLMNVQKQLTTSMKERNERLADARFQILQARQRDDLERWEHGIIVMRGLILDLNETGVLLDSEERLRAETDRLFNELKVARASRQIKRP